MDPQFRFIAGGPSPAKHPRQHAAPVCRRIAPLEDFDGAPRAGAVDIRRVPVSLSVINPLDDADGRDLQRARRPSFLLSSN